MTRKCSISSNFYINKKFNHHSFKDNSSYGNDKLGHFLENILKDTLPKEILFEITYVPELNINFLLKKEYLKSNNIFDVEKNIDQIIKKTIDYLKSFSEDINIWDAASITHFKDKIKTSLIMEEKKILNKTLTKKTDKHMNQQENIIKKRL